MVSMHLYEFVNGINGVFASLHDLYKPAHFLQKHLKCEKSMLIELIHEHSNDVYESLGSVWNIFRCSLMFMVNFMRMLFFVVSDGRRVVMDHK